MLTLLRRCSAARTRRARLAGATLSCVLLLASCATFPDSQPSFTVQPSLTPNEVQVQTPTPSGSTPASTPASANQPPQSSEPAVPDPCAPTDPAVVATCLHAPWGLAPLPDGSSALVGERTTGKIFKVAQGAPPVLVATVDGIDPAGSGGLLGIALSPYYLQDDLIYAYVTTDTDNRILRIAPGDNPKAIFTGIPKGDAHNGGPIQFGPDNMLYVATGDAGHPADAANPTSLAGKVLRLDGFGKPAASNPTEHSPVYAAGFTDPTGMCVLPGGGVGTLDHRPTTDLLIPVRAGKNYSTIGSGDALWTYQPGDGGATDCTVSDNFLISSSLTNKQLSSVAMTGTGGFSGSPQALVPDKYGRLLTVTTGAGGLVWFTTSNKDGHGTPIPSDDRVVVLPSAGGEGGNGPD